MRPFNVIFLFSITFVLIGFLINFENPPVIMTLKDLQEMLKAEYATFRIEAEEEVGSSSESKSNYESLKVFSEVLSLNESTYVEKVSSEKLIEGAIHGLGKTLDPHTSYLPPDAYQEMKVQTSGKFGGLGIEVSMRD